MKIINEKQEINSGHYHEIADRCHIILSSIDDNLIDHPGMTDEMNNLCIKAQENLSKVMNLAWIEQEKKFPKQNRLTEDEKGDIMVLIYNIVSAENLTNKEKAINKLNKYFDEL